MEQSHATIFGGGTIGGHGPFAKVKLILWSKFFLVAAIIVAITLPAFGFALMRLNGSGHVTSERYRLEQDLLRATNQVRLSFFEAELVAGKIEGLLSVSAGIPEVKIEKLVEEFLLHNTSVLAVALAPDLVVTHSFPESENQKTIGLKYWELPAQMASVARAYRQASSVVSGPVHLVQGGQGYILRHPVFLPQEGSAPDRFWGIISTVIRADGLFSERAAASLDGKALAFSLHEVRTPDVGMGVNPDDMIVADVAQTDPIVVEFPMVDSVWRASAAPRGGWPTMSPLGPLIMASSVILALMIGAVLLALHRVSQGKERAHALLLESIACMNEGFIAFDEKDRLVTANQRFLDYYPEIADKMVPGASFGSLMAVGLERKQFPDAEGREEEWIKERDSRFRNPSGSFVERTRDRQWLKVTEAKTPYGYTVGIRTDVTAEKRAINAAQEADHEKTQFISNVSHELRTPLTVISGRAAFLENQDRLPLLKQLDELILSSSGLSEEAKRVIVDYKAYVSGQGGKIVESARHMIRLVEDLLDWTTVERGTMQIKKEVFSIESLTDAVAEELCPQAFSKGLEFKYSRTGQVDILADRTRLRQILYNLVSNAIKFTDHGQVSLTVRGTEAGVEILIADTGCGIPNADLDRVFERFQQVDDSMTRKKGGFGLGLSIAKQLTVLHDGQLTVSSDLGTGSCFTLNLPRSGLAPEMMMSA